jgi:hypothetical protein
MDLFHVAVPVAGDADARELFALLRKLHVRLDPCAGDPRFDRDGAGRRRLLIAVQRRVVDALREAQREVEVVRDLADLPDPRSYVSGSNRFAEPLARARARKGRT